MHSHKKTCNWLLLICPQHTYWHTHTHTHQILSIWNVPLNAKPKKNIYSSRIFNHHHHHLFHAKPNVFGCVIFHWNSLYFVPFSDQNRFYHTQNNKCALQANKHEQQISEQFFFDIDSTILLIDIFKNWNKKSK